MNNNKIKIFDTTLRDGMQGEGISFSVQDKLKIVKALDSLGISYIEAGYPGSNPKDMEFFKCISELRLKHSKLTAFGSTRRKNTIVEENKEIRYLIDANVPVTAIFGKSSAFHVTDIIKTTLEENLNMIRDTVAFLKQNVKEVVYDAEHFFDGYKLNPKYAMQTLQTAAEAGADVLVLCDTNGGALPAEVYDITKKVAEHFPVEIGIHSHNDGGMAVANSVMAVEAGATHVQGTFNGLGERCGNTNLCVAIPNLQLKRQKVCITKEQMQNLAFTARYIAEVSNVALNEREPYVGRSAFAHKGGMHIDGVNKVPSSFEHIKPETVGNERRFLMSEISGRSTIYEKIKRVNPSIRKHSKETERIVERLKELEYMGYQFEGAESTFELEIHKQLGKYKSFFELEHFKVIDEQLQGGESNCTAIIKIKVDGEEEMAVAEGNGPVNALDKALRKALEVFYPILRQVFLTDYKVRVLDANATASKVRVLIESTDGENTWSNVGVSTDIISASWVALVDSIEYKLLKDIKKKYGYLYNF